MTIRTNRLYGKVWGDPSNPATLVVNFNNEQVFSGTVPTTVKDFKNPDIGEPVPWHSLTDYDLLCSWDTDLATVDSTPNPVVDIPVSIAVTGGDLLLSSIKMNQVRTLYGVVIKDSAVWPKYVPLIQELQTDNKLLNPTEFEEKYGLDKIQVVENLSSIVITPIENYFTIPSIDPDNKINVKVNDELQSKSPEMIAKFPNGDWKWFSTDGDILTFDYRVNI
jgi:hypothetical protein